MQILLNSNNEIVAYATIGTLENGYQINAEVMPNDFFDSFEPLKFKLKDGVVINNGNFVSKRNLNEQLADESKVADESLRSMFADYQMQNVDSSVELEVLRMNYEDLLERVERLEAGGN